LGLLVVAISEHREAVLLKLDLAEANGSTARPRTLRTT
jgi:hypothetical protein